MAKTLSGELQRSSMAVSGWSERPFPVLLVYLVNAASNSASKLEVGEVVLMDKAMGMTGGVMGLHERERGKVLQQNLFERSPMI